jgi:hypothetical protein
MPIYNTKFILLNGPKHTGKSQIIAPCIERLIKAKFPASEENVVIRESFASPIKTFISAALGMSYEQMKKDTPNPVLNGYSVREALIALAETHVKPIYGKDIYGRWLLHRVTGMNPIPHFVVVDDCGFQEEVDGLVGNNTRNRILVRVERPGYDFRGDSRGYLNDPNASIINSDTIENLMQKCIEFVDNLIE